MKSTTKIVTLLLICASALTLDGCVLAIGNRDAKTGMCGQNCGLTLKSPDGKLWRVSVDNNGRLGTEHADMGSTDNRSVGAPTKYSPDKDTEPIPTVDLGAKK